MVLLRLCVATCTSDLVPISSSLGLPRSLVVVSLPPVLSSPCLLALLALRDLLMTYVHARFLAHSPIPLIPHPNNADAPAPTAPTLRSLEDEAAPLVSGGVPRGGSGRRMALAPASEAALPLLPVLQSSCPRRYVPPPSLAPQLLAAPGGELLAGGRQ